MHTESTSDSLSSESSTTHFPWWIVAALVVGAVALCLLPIVLGAASLFFRDVLNFHWPAKVEQVRAWREGVLPFVDLWRSGGQPGLGNLNTVPLYPSNLLPLVLGGSLGGLAWAFNAHFWLHLVFAPLAFYWMARGLRLKRPGSWMGAVLFGSSGFAVSMLGFYNLVAALVWVPMLIGALVRTVEAPVRRDGRCRPFLVLAASWALLLLAGDPATSALGLLAGLLYVVILGFSSRIQKKIDAAGVLFGFCGLLAGTLMAWPQFHALLSTLDGSVRATLGYSNAGVLRGSWHPAMLADSFLPFVLGAPNQLFWGTRFHAGAQPFFYTFFPGVLALVLGAVALLQRGRWRQAPLMAGLLWAGLGLFVALGSFNPLVAQVSQWIGASWLRFPVKFWWWVALGIGLVGGHALDDLIEGSGVSGPLREANSRARTIARRVCGLLGGLYLAVLVAMAFGLFLPGYERFIGGSAAGEVAAEALPRLMMAACMSVLLCAVLWLLVSSATALQRGGWVVLVVLHIVSQMVILRPLYPTLPTAEILAVPEILQGVAPTALLAHGSVGARFGVGPGDLPGEDHEGQTEVRDTVGLAALQRSAQHAGYPSAGVAAGHRYQLNSSPEGLDSYLPGFFAQVLKSVPDADRVRLLEALGVTHLLVERSVSSPGLILERRSGSSQPVFRYALPAARPVLAATQWFESTSPKNTLEVLLDPQFDPGAMLVIPFEQGSRDRQRIQGGEAPVTLDPLESDRHGLRLRTNSAVPLVVALDRTYLPRYRATIDGETVPTTRANLVRLAVRVPAGSHELVVSYDRSGWRKALMVSVGGWLLMFAGAFHAWRRR